MTNKKKFTIIKDLKGLFYLYKISHMLLLKQLHAIKDCQVHFLEYQKLLKYFSFSQKCVAWLRFRNLLLIHVI